MNGTPERARERGIALIVVLLVSTLVFVMALGLSLVTAVEQLVTRNHRESAALLHAAEGALELAARALARAGPWDPVLAGLVQADAADGPPTGTRSVGGIEVDLAVQTSLLNCARPAGCSDADRRAVTAARPWGANNPHWRLFLYGPLSALADLQYPAAAYVLVWVADDGRERDGDPERDGVPAGAGEAGEPGEPGEPGEDGADILRVRADAFGRDGGRRAVEAELARVCRVVEGVRTCLPGIRVQSWRDVRHAVP